MAPYDVKRLLALFLLLSALLLAACSAGGQEPSSETETLVYANLTPNGVDRAAVSRFNAAHAGEVQIEVQDYFDEDGRSGTARLMAEMATGHGPDILDARGLPCQMLAQKGYLEDLWPYIDSDPDLGREGVVEEPLKAAEVDGGLYVLFNQVLINTLVGAESIVGDRYSWTFEELLNAFSTMPEDSTILEYFTTKDSMCYYIFRMDLERYVDRETGQCTFDSDSFRASLEFINSFPQEFDWGDGDEANEELTERLLSGRQMLRQCVFWRLADIQFLDAMDGLGGRASFVGYPTEDGSTGSSFYLPYHAKKLAMASGCKNKEAAWDFLRQLMLPQYADMDDERLWNNMPQTLPLNRLDYDRIVRFDMNQKYAKEMSRILYSGPIVHYRAATKEELARYEDFISHIDKIELYDNTIYDIVQETSGAYFAGDSTLEETIDLIQRRVSLYINENL